MVDKMWTTTRLLVVFIWFNLLSCKQALRKVEDMNWSTSPSAAWPPVSQNDRFVHRIVILLLNIANYSDNGLEWTFIASGILLDNSRILTSYNPFRELIGSSNITDNILALLVTGVLSTVTELRIANIVCGRQIAYLPDGENHIWHDRQHSPLHDLMVLRMEEEIGIARRSTKYWGFATTPDSFYWYGELVNFTNSLISFPAGLNDQIDSKVRIFSLGYRHDYDIIHDTDYEEDDAVLADCEEWLPRQWGYFICIRNIDNFPGLGSGATLFSKNKLFGIGSFAMYKNDTGVLVFTDVRFYEELILKTCGDEEFT